MLTYLLATNSIGNTFRVLMHVSAILFICSIEIGIGNTFSLAVFDTGELTLSCAQPAVDG